MWTYIIPNSGLTGHWTASSLHTADCLQRGPLHAWSLQDWVQAFVTDQEDLPVNPMDRWNESVIDKDPTIAQETHAHLQGIRKFVKAMDLVNFMDTSEIRAKSGLKRRIDILTAQRWMKKLNYHWTYEAKSQYVDGHEWEDVVAYCQNIFLPRWVNIKARTHDWSNGQLDPLLHK